nr:uncharacterized transmembrane protein DDB_G0289901-like [Anolis sagrei ordinatus]
MGAIKMEKYSVFAVILYAACLCKVLGYPYNDVSIACDSMLPDRGSGPQRSPPPYVISVSFDRYDPGNEIQVTLESTSPFGFKAFMAQAREVDGNIPVGMFRIVDPNTRGLPCANVSNSAVSHRGSNVKHRIQTSWIAPMGTRRIRIMATFVQDYNTYWVGVHSKTLSPRSFDIANDTESFNDTTTTNTSDVANITSVISKITVDSETPDEELEELDFNNLLPEAEAKFEPPVKAKKTEDFQNANAIRKSRRKSVVTFDINCSEGGTYQSSSGGCVKNVQGSSYSSSKPSEVIVITQGKGSSSGGSSSSSGCIGGKLASVYNKYGCGDAGTDISGQSSYGQSSTNAGSKVKVYTYPQSNPFPPEVNTFTLPCFNFKTAGYKSNQIRQSQNFILCDSFLSGLVFQANNAIFVLFCFVFSSQQRESTSSKFANPKYNGAIYSKGLRPQSGSSETIRITVQSGQGSPACDKSSTSYNIQACNQLGQSSSSQSSSSFGAQSGKFSPSSNSIYSQGSRTQSGSSETVRIIVQDQPSGSQGGGTYGIQGQSSGSQSSSSYGTQGGSYSSGGSPCGQGTTYDSNPCHQNQGSSSSSSSSYSSSSYGNQGQASSYGNQGSLQYQGNSNGCNSGSSSQSSYNNQGQSSPYGNQGASSYNHNRC